MIPSAPSPPHTALVLVNWNSGPLTLECLESVEKGEIRPSHILVFDNGSADKSPDRISGAHPRVLLVRSPDNIGFAAACNWGIRWALAQGCDLVWLLNNDTRVAPDCLRRLEDTLHQHPDVGVATGKIFRSHPPDTLWYAGGKMDWHVATPIHVGSWEKDQAIFQREADTEFVSGCCMLVRATVFRNVGVFDEKYFAYFEDVDWCLRAHEKGIRMRFQPNAVLWHKEHGSVERNRPADQGRTSPLFVYLFIRNTLFTILRHGPAHARYRPIAHLLRLSAGIAFRLCLRLRVRKLACLWGAWADGLAGKPRWTGCGRDVAKGRHTGGAETAGPDA